MSVKRYSWEREDKLPRRSSYWGHWSRTCCSSSMIGSAKGSSRISSRDSVSSAEQNLQTRLMRLRRFSPYRPVSTLSLCELDLSFADAGFQVKVEVFFFTEIVFDAIVEFLFPVLGSVQVPNLLKPCFHGGPNFTRPRKFVQPLIF